MSSITLVLLMLINTITLIAHSKTTESKIDFNMLKKLRIGLLVFFISVCYCANSQTEYGETLKSRLYVGGTFGLGIGTVTNIDISPMVGFNINRHFSAGLGTTYMFYSYRYGSINYSSHFYGGRVFGRIVPLPDQLPSIFLHGEYETINNEREIQEDFNSPYILKRTWTPALLIGAGFKQQAGNNSFFTATILYNAIDDGTSANTIYGGPLVYRVGFIFGLY